MPTKEDYEAFMAKGKAPLAAATRHKAKDGSKQTIVDITESTRRRNQYEHITNAICLLAGKDPTDDPHLFRRIFWGKELKRFRECIVAGQYDKDGVNLLDRLRRISDENPEQLVTALWRSWWCTCATALFKYAVRLTDPEGLVRVSLFLKWCELKNIPFPPGRRWPKARGQLHFKDHRCEELEIFVSSSGLRIKRLSDTGPGKKYTLEDLSLTIPSERSKSGELTRWIFEIAKNKQENAVLFEPTLSNHLRKTRFNQCFKEVTGVIDNLLSSRGRKLMATAGRMTLG